MFDSFFTSFQILFVVFFILIIITIIYQIVRSRKTEQQKEMPTMIREREIIKEIVKIRCPYCNSLYDEKEDKCPNCGGKRQ